MGDSGAFSYRHSNRPFTRRTSSISNLWIHPRSCLGYGHREKNLDGTTSGPPSEIEQSRYTLNQARQFLDLHREKKGTFVPIGVIQAWSPKSAAQHARKLVEMGYDYIGLGGVAQRPSLEIIHFLTEIRSAISDDIRLHVFGLARFSSLSQFLGLGIESFDSSAPMLKAFKDDKANYFLPDMRYLAIRIPSTAELTRNLQDEYQIHAVESARLKPRIFTQLRKGQGIEGALDRLDAHLQLLNLPSAVGIYKSSPGDSLVLSLSGMPGHRNRSHFLSSLSVETNAGYRRLHALAEIVRKLNVLTISSIPVYVRAESW